MAFIKNAWYVACWGDEVKPGEMFNRKLLGDMVVFFRKEDGTLAALQDRCRIVLFLCTWGRSSATGSSAPTMA